MYKKVIMYIPRQYRSDVMELATHIAGGATMYPAEGSWVDEGGVVLYEPVVVMHVIVDEQRAQRLIKRVGEYLQERGEYEFLYEIQDSQAVFQRLQSA